MPLFRPVLFRLIWLCLPLLPVAGAAQSYTQQDSVRIYQLLDLADQEDFAGNLDKAMQHAKEALELGLKKGMQRGSGFAYLKIADLQLKKEGTEGLPALYEEAFRYGYRLRDSFLLGLAWHQQAQYFRDQSKYKEAAHSLQEAIRYYAAGNQAGYTAIVYNDRGFVMERQGMYDSATAMYLQAIRFFEKDNNIKEAANTTGNLGITRYRMGLKQEAISLFRQSAAMRESIRDVKGLAAVYGNLVTAFSSLQELDSARHYQELALLNAEKTGVKNTLAQAHTNSSVLLARQQQYEEALLHEKEAVTLYTAMGDQQKIGNRYIVMAGYYDQLKDSVTAENYYAKAAGLAATLGNKPLSQSVYQAHSAFYTARGNYNGALQLYKKFVAVKDSLFNDRMAANINELKVQYETEKKDAEILKLKTDQQIRQLELEKQQALAAGHLLEAKRKGDQIRLLRQQEELRGLQLQQQKARLEKQELLARESEQQMLQSLQSLQIAENEKKLKQRQLEREKLLRNGLLVFSLAVLLIGGLLFNRYQLRKKIQEQARMMEVRNKISRDLHDDIGSTLTSIHIMSSVSQQVVNADPQQARNLLGEIAEQSRSIQQNMNDIVWAIRPDNDKVGNLSSRMLEFIGQTLEPRQIETRFSAAEEMMQLSLPMTYRKELLLMFREAVNNIVKHANARMVIVTLSGKQGNDLVLSIKDDGSWKNNPHNTGTGTGSIRQRAEALGGRAEWLITGAGTEVRIALPLP